MPVSTQPWSLFVLADWLEIMAQTLCRHALPLMSLPTSLNFLTVLTFEGEWNRNRKQFYFGSVICCTGLYILLHKRHMFYCQMMQLVVSKSASFVSYWDLIMPVYKNVASLHYRSPVSPRSGYRVTMLMITGLTKQHLLVYLASVFVLIQPFPWTCLALCSFLSRQTLSVKDQQKDKGLHTHTQAHTHTGCVFPSFMEAPKVSCLKCLPIYPSIYPSIHPSILPRFLLCISTSPPRPKNFFALISHQIPLSSPSPPFLQSTLVPRLHISSTVLPPPLSSPPPSLSYSHLPLITSYVCLVVTYLAVWSKC